MGRTLKKEHFSLDVEPSSFINYSTLQYIFSLDFAVRQIAIAYISDAQSTATGTSAGLYAMELCAL